MRTRATTVVAAAFCCAAAAAEPTETETVYYDAPDEAGRLSGGRVELPLSPIVRDRLAAAGARDADNRVDLVFVGDGYREHELPLYASDVARLSSEMFAYEPFLTYRPYFRITRVDVVSAESGVDNDPAPGVDRDTALDMAFWCSGIERLLCVNVAKAYAAASAAPDVDQICALANATMYGGAGYTSSDLATASAGNGWAADILVHEIGHSLGDLADEYDYADGSTYTGSERPEPNVSILPAPDMLAAGTKWAGWLGHAGPGFDGPVETYEGAYYNEFGVYRPSPNSMMRSLGRPFNAPSAEAVIAEIYAVVSPIEAVAPAAGAVAADQVLSVVPMQPDGHDLAVAWDLDGSPLPDAAGRTSLDLGTLDLPGSHTVTATVWDPTPMVRDETLRAQAMTASVTWTVAGACPPDMTAPYGELDFFDILRFLERFDAHDPGVDLTAPFGVWDVFDVLGYLALFDAGCP